MKKIFYVISVFFFAVIGLFIGIKFISPRSLDYLIFDNRCWRNGSRMSININNIALKIETNTDNQSHLKDISVPGIDIIPVCYIAVIGTEIIRSRFCENIEIPFDCPKNAKYCVYSIYKANDMIFFKSDVTKEVERIKDCDN